MDINYTKAITDITFPYMDIYAKKINAEFKVIKERKFLDQPTNIEKFQLYELSRDYDWTIFIDADAIIHPNTPDLTELCNKNIVIFNRYDLYPIRFKPNNYSRRDGRNIGASTWFTCFSDWTRHIWKPYEDSKKYINQINLTTKEANFGYSPEHILDDYLVSRNISKYGIQVKTILYDIFSSHFRESKPLFFIHHYCISLEEKINFLNYWNNKIKKEKYSIYKPMFETLEMVNNINYS